MTMKGGISDDFLVTIFSSQAISNLRIRLSGRSINKSILYWLPPYLSNHSKKVKLAQQPAPFIFRQGELSSSEFQGLPIPEVHALRERLATSTFPHVGIKVIEFQAMPGPEARAWCEKTRRPASFLGSGGPCT